MSGLDRRRIAQQQAALRVVNNAIATGRAGTGADLIPVLCECGEVGCNTLIEIGHQDYREVRGDPRRFVVRAGHDVDGVDTVVGRCPGGAVVVEAGPDLASEVT